jgi:hypothetical protein
MRLIVASGVRLDRSTSGRMAETTADTAPIPLSALIGLAVGVK